MCRAVVAHDSYLINLASPDPELRARSIKSFIAELQRCEMLGIRAVVSHPGNYLDDRGSGLSRNAESYIQCLEAVPGSIMVLLETTAGTGTALGSSFEEMAELRARIPSPLRRRIGFCADTCHLYAAGYDLVRDYEGIWQRWDDLIGLKHLRCLHLNDSKTPLGSRRDRHELIGEGSLGPSPVPSHHDRSPFQPCDEGTGNAQGRRSGHLRSKNAATPARLCPPGRTSGRVDLLTFGRSFLGDAIQPHRAGARPHADAAPRRPGAVCPVAGWHRGAHRSSPITSSTTSSCNRPWHRS